MKRFGTFLSFLLTLTLFQSSLALAADIADSDNPAPQDCGIDPALVTMAPPDTEYFGYIVKLKEAPPAGIAAFGADPAVSPDLVCLVETLDEALTLAPEEYIEYIMPNYALEAYAFPETGPNDAQYNNQWYLNGAYGIHAEAAWKKGYRGKGVKVALMDTGLYSPESAWHEDLQQADILPTIRFSYASNDPEKNNIFDTYRDNAGQLVATGHGTPVTGVLAAQTNNGKGIAGIADRATVQMMKVMPGGPAQLARAIQDAAANDFQVINISLGTNAVPDYPELKAAVDAAAERGIILVAAVGNGGGNGDNNQPARFEHVIGVGSTDINGNLSSFSQRSNVFVVAPGGGHIQNQAVLSTTKDGGYGRLAGTSLSAPIVAGMAGMAKEVSREITTAGFKLLLEWSSDHISGSGGNYDPAYDGHGRVNMEKFVDYLTTNYAIHYLDGTTVLSTGAFQISEGAILYAPRKEGWAFDGWYPDAALSEAPMTAIPAGVPGEKTLYASWAPTSLNRPVLVEEHRIKTGTARPPAESGNPAAKPFVAENMSSWFTDADGDSLTWEVRNMTGAAASTVKIEGKKLTFTPTKDQANQTVTIAVGAFDGGNISEDVVLITITVDAVPANAGTGGSGGGSGSTAGGTKNEEEKTNAPTPGTPENPWLEAYGVEKIFSDIRADAWYVKSIQFVYDRQLFQGMGGGIFEPNRTMTREMFLTVLGRLAGVHTADFAGRTFLDQTNDWSAPYIEWAYQNQIARGIGGGYFGAAAPVTREQMAVLIYNYAQQTGAAGAAAGTLTAYADAQSVSDWAAEALSWMTANGIITGKPGNLLDPGGPSTRAEVAAVMERLDALTGSKQDADTQ